MVVALINTNIRWCNSKTQRKFLYVDYPLLLAIQPRRGTVTNWRRAKEYLETILGKRKINWKTESSDRVARLLDPCQLEVVCSEFLRSDIVPTEIRLDFLLLPIGRTLKDVDIVGISKQGKKIFAQVTHGSSMKEISEKVDALRNYHSKENLLIFFGPRKLKIGMESLKPIKYIPIENVVEQLFSNEGTLGYKMISNMLNWLEAQPAHML